VQNLKRHGEIPTLFEVLGFEAVDVGSLV